MARPNGRNIGGYQAYRCVRCGVAWSQWRDGERPAKRTLSGMCMACVRASLDRPPVERSA